MQVHFLVDFSYRLKSISLQLCESLFDNLYGKCFCMQDLIMKKGGETVDSEDELTL